jgi:hypothetical protein
MRVGGGRRSRGRGGEGALTVEPHRARVLRVCCGGVWVWVWGVGCGVWGVGVWRRGVAIAVPATCCARYKSL